MSPLLMLYWLYGYVSRLNILFAFIIHVQDLYKLPLNSTGWNTKAKVFFFQHKLAWLYFSAKGRRIHIEEKGGVDSVWNVLSVNRAAYIVNTSAPRSVCNRCIWLWLCVIMCDHAHIIIWVFIWVRHLQFLYANELSTGWQPTRVGRFMQPILEGFPAYIMSSPYAYPLTKVHYVACTV